PDDPRPGGGAAGGLGPESPEGFHPTGSSIEPRRGSTPPAAHREPLESLVLEEPGPDERRHTGVGRGQSAGAKDYAPRHGPAPKAHFRANRHADRRPGCEDPAGEDVQGLLALAAPHDDHAGAEDRGAACAEPLCPSDAGSLPEDDPGP